MEDTRGAARATSWTWVAVALSAVYTYVVLVRPAWGLTFVMDDWEHLYRLHIGTWPSRWFVMAMEHWTPTFWMLLDLKRTVFGMNHDLYLLSNWLGHVLNVWLLARLLHARTGSEPAAALAALAFGLTTHTRELVWWSSLAGWTPCLSFSILGFWALERHRAGGPLWPALAAVFMAPTCMGGGLALGPGLVAEAALLMPRGRRMRAILGIALAWAAYVGIFLVEAKRQGHPTLVPRNGDQALLALGFAVDMVGAGMLGGILLEPMGGTPRNGGALAAAYFLVVVALLVFLGGEARRRILAAHVYLAVYVAMVALTRWSFGPSQATTSRYQYLPVICWTTVLALALAPAWRRSARATLALAVLALAALALGHAWGARSDRQPYAPEARRGHPELLAHLVRACAAASGPVYDAPLPFPLAQRTTRVAHVLTLYAPRLATTFTNARTPATVAPYERDELLRGLAVAR